MPTFREAACAVHEANRPRWRNASHIANWMQTLERHAMPTLSNTPLDRIDRGDVLRVLTPIWTTRPETARRVRQRMRTVFRWAMAHGFMQTNPAGEAIDGALPPMPKVKAHLRALPYQEVGAALKTVEASQASIPARLCFRFLVLTAARSGEARGATWDEIDMEGQVWRIPSERMKAGMEHRVPLSGQAIELLGEASVLSDETGLVFPSPLKAGAPMSDMTLTKVLRSTGLAERATVHGFRSSFKNWTLEQTDAPWAVSEAALAHILGKLDRTGLRQVRSVRAPPRADAAVGGLPDRTTSREVGTARPSRRFRSCRQHLGRVGRVESTPCYGRRDSNQSVMSLALHLTAAEPTLTGLGNSPSCMSL